MKDSTDASIDMQDVEQIRTLVDEARRVAIVCHMTPDGDALGSSLCLWHVMLAMGRDAVVVVPDAFPADLSFLPGADRVVVASYNIERAESALRGADLIFCLDFNEPSRIDRLAEPLSKATAPKVMIDHHLNPQEGFCKVTISSPERSSTCLLLYLTLKALGWEKYVGLFASECCMTGMMTDTGNFSFNANDADIYAVMAELMAKGVDKNALTKRLFDTSTLRRLRIMGYAQYKCMTIYPEHRCAVIALSADDLADFGYKKGDTEALVNVPLSVPEIVWSVYLRESSSDYVKVSMRSKGDFSVREICANHFGGGGHLNASGGEVHGSLQDALDRLMDVMPQYDMYLPLPKLDKDSKIE